MWNGKFLLMSVPPTHESLDAWKIAIEFAAEVYRVTSKLPRDERFGLTSQMRRAAVSVSSNIAEGTGRHSYREMLHFIAIARGSLREVESLTHLCERLNYLTRGDLTEARALADRSGKLLTGLRKSLATT